MQASAMQPISTAGAGVIVSGRPANMMNPIDSVITCFQKYVGFKGVLQGRNIGGSSYSHCIAYIIAAIMDAIIFGIELTDPTPISWTLQLGYCYHTLAVSVRRLHDIGKSGWYVLITLIPIAINNFIVWYCNDGEPIPNMYGPVPTNTRDVNSGTQYVIVQQPMQQQ